MLEDLQFSLPMPDGSGDYRFGRKGFDEVVIPTTGWNTGTSSWRTQDTQPPFSDVTMVGRDYRSTPTWTFAFLIERDRDVMGALDLLEWVWSAPQVRTTPGAVVPLRYARAGGERVVYGRPSDFTREPPDVWSDDYAFATAQFTLTDPTSYDAQEWSQTLGLAPPPRSFWIWGQFVYPWRPVGVVSPRQGVVDVGSSPVPFRVEFVGDPSRASQGVTLAMGDEWRISLRERLTPGQRVVVDTRARTVTRDGEPVSGLLSADSMLGARLPAGRPEVAFTADWVTGATATVTWRPGYVSI